MIKLKLLKRGTYFCKKEISFPNESQVWIKGDYEKSLRKYCCYRFSDVNDFCYISGDKEVYTNIIF